MPKEGNPFDGERLEYTVERTPTVLILDTSQSMTQSPPSSDTRRIDLLNDGLEQFKREVMEKSHTERRVDVSVVTFGRRARVEQEFTQVKNWTPPTLNSGGRTPMSDAIETSIDLVEKVKSTYRADGISYNRPILWLLTDGKPDVKRGSERWQVVKRQLEVGTKEDKFIFFALGMGEADTERLGQLVEGTGRPAHMMKPGQFAEFFKFVSNSLESHSEQSGDPGIADQDMNWAQFE